MDHFELVSEYQPTGDQPAAIAELVKGFQEGNQAETLLGVTGSGKTFTMANVIQQLQKSPLVLAHNKTLAAQLYGEFETVVAFHADFMNKQRSGLRMSLIFHIVFSSLVT